MAAVEVAQLLIINVPAAGFAFGDVFCHPDAEHTLQGHESGGRVKKLSFNT